MIHMVLLISHRKRMDLNSQKLKMYEYALAVLHCQSFNYYAAHIAMIGVGMLFACLIYCF